MHISSYLYSVISIKEIEGAPSYTRKEREKKLSQISFSTYWDNFVSHVLTHQLLRIMVTVPHIERKGLEMYTPKMYT